jgi:hypothetical protein
MMLQTLVNAILVCDVRLYDAAGKAQEAKLQSRFQHQDKEIEVGTYLSSDVAEGVLPMTFLPV